MIDTVITQCVPQPFQTRPLTGLYLEHRLHLLGTYEKPVVYGNFLTSLDGRIAIGADESNSITPAGLGTAEDWYLLQELEAQADCIVVHGAYLRALEAGRLGNVLQVGIDEATQSLKAWRLQNGLNPQPDVVVVSASLDFSVPPSVSFNHQRVIIATNEHAPPDRVQQLRDKGFQVWSVGSARWVEGGSLVRLLSTSGYRSIYLLAGPRILATMLRSDALSRLYLTLSHCVVGGDEFHTLFRGEKLSGLVNLELNSLHYQAASENQAGQFYMSFSRQR